MECPRCGSELTSKDVMDHEILSCNSCKGMWLHRHQLNELLHDVSDNVGDFETISVEYNPDGERLPEITCIECGDVQMDKINFLEYSDIIIDHCPRCGSFWLDKDELDKMEEYTRKIDEGSKEVQDHSLYTFMRRLGELAYSLFK